MKLYVVRWAHGYYYPGGRSGSGFPHFPAPTRLVKSFTDPIAAEAYRQRLERGWALPPAEANPFRALGQETKLYLGVRNLSDLTHMPVGALADWLREVGLEPPAPEADGLAWATWYNTQTPTMTEAQRCRVWQALDKLRFFETVETEWEA